VSDPGADEARTGSPRHAGLLLHLTCLPGPHGIGDLGPAAHALLDWLATAGLDHWQILPVGPTGYGDSPYGALSAFAGNPLLISPDALLADGLLEASEIEPAEASEAASVDFERVRARKELQLAAARHRFRTRETSAAGSAELPGPSATEWERFRDDPATRAWLDDWTLFAALKERFEGRSWLDWPRPLRLREPDALRDARAELADRIELRAFEQFLFARQWEALRAAASGRGVRLLGDIPIYPALDSADVWSRRELFRLDADGRPLEVAGVPPDYFSDTGQLWGNPLFDWKRMRDDGYAWWIERLRVQSARFDRLRLDHFRGFADYWAVPAGDRDATGGRWRRGPGRALFRAVRKALGELPLVAEDLGQIDDRVHLLRDRLGLPGMRVLQFGFDEPDSLHAPHRHPERAVAYTGTHDNDTARSWFDGLSDEVRARVVEYLGADPADAPWALVRAAATSPAALAILPLQDLLGLPSAARLNAPGRDRGNWRWRIREDEIPVELAPRLRRLLAAGARAEPEESATAPSLPEA